MNAVVPIDDIIQRLRTVSETDGMPRRAVERADTLLERLTSPVRVSLLGFPKPEKSHLFNALAGEAVIEFRDCNVPYELCYGGSELTEVTMPDGTTAIHPGPFSASDHPDAVFLSIRQPLPALERISLIDVNADDTPEDQLAAINWALPRTDIALWCSSSFSDAELRIWETVPDAIMDHAYLVLTGEPGGPDHDALATHATRLKTILSDYFLDILGVGYDGDGADAQLSHIGVDQLSDSIRRQADQGQRADADSAMVFLATIEKRRTRPLRNSRRTQTRPLKAARDQNAPPPAQMALYATAFGYLRDRGSNLLSTLRASDEPDPLSVISHCGETLSTIVDMLNDHEEESNEDLAALAGTLAEAQELSILLELEKGEGPVIDAVSLLLQIRRDFEARLAA